MTHAHPVPASPISHPRSLRPRAALTIATVLATATASVALAPAAQAAVSADAPVVISEVYGGGGNAGAALARDFIELANVSDATVDLSAYSVQYASATGGSWQVTPLTGITVPAGAEHKLVRGGDHVMLMGLKAPLENGQDVALSLDFGPCGTVAAVVPVDNDRKPEEAAPMHHGAHAMPTPATN